MRALITTFIFFVTILFFSCKNENETDMLICGVKDPIKDLPWLNKEFKSLIGGPEINAIVLYIYNNNYVIEIQGSLFSSQNLHQYNCDGTKIYLEGLDFKKFLEVRKEVKVLFGTKIWN